MNIYCKLLNITSLASKKKHIWFHITCYWELINFFKIFILNSFSVIYLQNTLKLFQNYILTQSLQNINTIKLTHPKSQTEDYATIAAHRISSNTNEPYFLIQPRITDIVVHCNNACKNSQPIFNEQDQHFITM